MMMPPIPPEPPSNPGDGEEPIKPGSESDQDRAGLNTNPTLETDPRFPSGPWVGFFLMKGSSKRHGMELGLTFRQGTMTGEGRDQIGDFLIRGRYTIEDGKCWWTKSYIGLHDVFYHGYNEGKGIWGVWEIPPSYDGGFHIWPIGMGDPTQPKIAEAIDRPVEAEPQTSTGILEEVKVEEPIEVAVPA